jgi:integrase
VGRSPTPLGSWGNLRCYVVERTTDGKPTKYKARTLFRGFDGVTRSVERWGRSKTAAESNLKAALKEHTLLTSSGGLASVDRFSKAHTMWLAAIAELVEHGSRSPGTLQVYESQSKAHILPALGAVRLGELTPPLLDRFLRDVSRSTGVPTARTCRSILSGVLGLTVRYGALPTNPIRDVQRLEGGRPKKEPRALTLAERRHLFASLADDAEAVRHDIPDLSRFMLATGQRIGECLAVLWMDLDLTGSTVDVNSTVIRLKGEGLLRKTTKTRAGQRVLILPSWAIADLQKRRSHRPIHLAEPVFPDSIGGLRDPSNTRRVLREALDRAGYQWVTSHNFRKTTATLLDEAGMSARVIADQLGHAQVSMTQDVYMGRKSVDPRAAAALEDTFGRAEPAQDPKEKL